MSTARILVASVIALALAIGASSTAAARSSFGFSINSGGPPVWGYPAYVYPAPAYYLPPPPPPPPVFYAPAPRRCNPLSVSVSYHGL